jgi:hypothetical protein
MDHILEEGHDHPDISYVILLVDLKTADEADHPNIDILNCSEEGIVVQLSDDLIFQSLQDFWRGKVGNDVKDQIDVLLSLIHD